MIPAAGRVQVTSVFVEPAVVVAKLSQLLKIKFCFGVLPREQCFIFPPLLSSAKRRLCGQILDR